MNCGFFEIPSTILSVSGRDAARYLQARLSNDIKSLTPGEFCEAAALTPQGRTEAFCAVIARSPRDYLLLCESDRQDEIHAAVKRFLVAEQAEIKNVSPEFTAVHLACAEEFAANQTAPLATACTAPPPPRVLEQDGLLVIHRRRTPAAGRDILIPAAQAREFQSLLTQAGVPQLDSEEQKLLRLRAGIPSFPEELNPDRLFSESGLMHAVSFTKGCYTGQEVVAKIDALGKTPRVLKRLALEGAQALPSGSTVTDGEAGPKIGVVLSSAADADAQRTWCFCDLKNMGEFSGVSPYIDGRPARFSERT